MIVEMSVVFNKSTYMKNKILNRTIPDNQEDFNVRLCLFSFGLIK
jgi:hypothetical protein